MKLFPVLVFLVVADLTGAVPTQCLSCGLGSFDAANCVIRFQEHSETCATSEESLGTTHCGTAAITYVVYGTNVTRTGIYRGCVDCSDKTAACFAIGGFLRPRGYTVLQCEIECCSSSKCNTRSPSLSLNAVTVFSPNAPGGTKQCLGCRGGNPYQCSYQKRPQICATDFGSLGTTHCGSAIIKYREQRGGRISQSVLRGCINCADKKIACAAIRGGIKTQFGTLLECEIECCTGDNCNEDTGPGQCIKCVNSQFGPLTTCGSSEQWNQSCLIDPSSLGASHCGSAAIKYLDFSDETIKTDVIRGCFNCSHKKAACLTLGGYLKTFRVTLLECEIECCDSSNCNTQKLSLTQDAVRVFPPEASVRSRCQQCFEDNETECIQRQQLQDCGPDSLGTTHCGFAKIKFWSIFSIRNAVYKGCINCADKKAACAVLSGYVKSRRAGVIILACNIQCNEPGESEKTSGISGGHHILSTALLVSSITLSILPKD
ncbi:hypothetical protein ABFA07_020181 [Porites harrisoni]